MYEITRCIGLSGSAAMDGICCTPGSVVTATLALGARRDSSSSSLRATADAESRATRTISGSGGESTSGVSSSLSEAAGRLSSPRDAATPAGRGMQDFSASLSQRSGIDGGRRSRLPKSPPLYSAERGMQAVCRRQSSASARREIAPRPAVRLMDALDSFSPFEAEIVAR